MKPYNEQEFNRLCAEFIGWEYIPKDAHPYAFQNYGWWIKDTYSQDVDPFNNPNWKAFNSSLKFHSDWNWIMEVVEKISNIPDGVGYVFVRDLDGVMHKKQVVVESIWQFLNWYNEQKS